VVLELAERGELGAELALSPDLVFRFSVFSSVVASRRSQPPSVRLPFHHLKGDGFWEPLMKDGSPSPDKKLTTKVRLHPEFRECLQHSGFREQARRTIIAQGRYFNLQEQIALYALVGIPVPDQNVMREDAAQYRTEESKGREGRFRIDVVVVAYQHRCALTGYRLTTLGMESIVDAAHIHQFSYSKNNHPSNGLALCKNAHWQFDRGLWSVTDDFRVLVDANKFDESGGGDWSLVHMAGRNLYLPARREYWPSTVHLDWHRQNRFFAAFEKVV
ncbi:MAG: HNH endonuclease, partial [Verrucomicrobia bacterium]|nr:HNH endonuclease [Verrucomicrobiota bacterium]